MSANTDIGNTPVNQGYVQLIHTGETAGIDGNLRVLYDGDGTASDLSIASNKVKISTPANFLLGSDTITEFIQDVVGAMLTTGSYTNISTTYDDSNGNIDISSSGDTTASNTLTFTNKTIDADNNTLSNIEVDNFKSGVLDTDISSVAGTHTTLASAKAIKTYVDSEVADIVNSAPSTLDTLSELATALGNDDDFATTTATSLGQKLVKASNLSDLTNVATARTNLGLGSVATTSADIYLRSNADDTATGDLTLTGVVNNTNNLNVDGPNFNVSTTNKTTSEYAYRVDRSGSVVGGILIDGKGAFASGSTVGGNTILTTASTLSINNSNWSGTDLSVANGGTGVSTLTSNALLTGNGTSAIQSESNLLYDAGVLFFKGTDPSNTYGIKERIRLHRSGNNTDRQLQFYEQRHSGGRHFIQAFNTDITTDNSSAYTYTQGLYGGSSQIRFQSSGDLEFYNNAGASAGSQTTITPSLSLTLQADNDAIFGGDLYIPNVIYHIGDTDTYLFFSNNRIRLYAGGNLKVDTNDTYVTTSRQISTSSGGGLSGGGDLSSNRSLSLNVNNLQGQVPALELADKIAIYDNSESENNVATLTQLKAVVNTDTNTNQLTEFTLSGDSGSDQTISHGNTLEIAGGNGIATATSATDTITINYTTTGLTLDTSPQSEDEIVYQEAIGGAIKKTRIGSIGSSAVTSYTNSSNDRVLTSSGGTTINGESELTFDGGALNLLTTTGNRRIEIGLGATQDVTSFVDLIGDTTYTDYGGRFIRYGGANAETRIMHRGTGDLALLAQDSAAISLRTGSTERLRILSSGNVGIGVTPTHKLHVNGDLRVIGKVLGVFNTGFVSTDSVGNQATLMRQTSGDIMLIGDTNHTEQIKIQSAHSTGNGYIHCKNDGNIGFSGNTTFSSPMVVNYGVTINEGGHDNDTRIEGSSDANLVRVDASTNRVGIGTGSPSTKMHIKDASNNVDLRIETDKADGMAQVQYLNDARQYNVGINNADKFAIYDNTAGATRFDIDTDGDFKFHGTDSAFESVLSGGATYHKISGTATQRLEIRNTTTGAHGWIGIPSWNTDAWHFYGPTASSNELAYIYEASRHNFYRGLTVNNNQEDYDFIVKGDGDANLIRGDASTDRVGIGTSSPEGKVHIYNGNANVAPDSDGDELVVENSGDSGISILSGESNGDSGSLIFGSENDGNGAGVVWDYYNKILNIKTQNTSGILRLASNNNVEAMRILANGRVGVGTASPDTNFHVNASGAAGMVLRASDNSSNSARLFFDGTSTACIFQEGSDLSFRVNATTNSSSGTERVVINEAGMQITNGSLGVNTAPFSQNGYLTVASQCRVGINTGGVAITVNDGGGNANICFNHASKLPDQDGNSGRIHVNTDATSNATMSFELASNVTSGATTTTDDIFHIRADKKMAIGTTNFAFPGTLKVNKDNGTYTDWESIAAFQSKRSADSENEAGIFINSLGDALGGQISSNWYWNDNTGARGNTGRSSGIFGIANSTTTHSEFYWQNTPHNSNTLTTRMELDGATSTLHVDGDVVAFSTTTSDARLKDDVKTIDNALDKVMKLRGVEFTWNAHSRKGEKDIGLIAQEVEEIIPEIVREKEFKVGEFTDNKQVFKTIDYEKLVGVLIESVKELKTEIEEIKNGYNSK